MKKIGLLACAAIMCLFSCQKEEQSELYTVNDSDVLYASMEEAPSSKTAIGQERSVVWSESDCIISFMKKTLGCKYRITSDSVGQKSAQFTKVGIDMGESTALNHNVAYYPYDSTVACETSSEGTYTMSVTMPETQQYAAGGFAGNSFPMAAVSEDNNLTFQNVCGLLRLQLKGVQKVSSIKVQGNAGEQLSGSASLTVYADGNVPSVKMSEGSKTAVTLNCSPAVQLDEAVATDFYVIIPPVVFNDGFAVTVVDSDSNELVFKSAKQTKISRSVILNMPEIALPAPEEEEVTGDLAAAGTANSYIVPAEGHYYFPTVKGNTDVSVGEVAKAEVLWESYGTSDYLIAGYVIRNVAYADGVISFDTAKKFKTGNAVIAAKDADGKVLWSWHIWVTDYPKAHVYNNDAGVLMDRNLGATSADPGLPTSLGLLYQWGRKDPFINSGKVDESKAAYSSVTLPDPVEATEETGTVEYTIQNPTTFLYTVRSPYDWHFNSRNDELWTAQKTIYDPCPAGWRVPTGGSKGVWKVSGYSDFVFSESFGVNFPISQSETAWYPASGFISYEGILSLHGEYGFYWSVTPEAGSQWSYYMSIGLEGIRLAGINDRSYAYSVRCCQISE